MHALARRVARWRAALLLAVGIAPLSRAAGHRCLIARPEVGVRHGSWL